jgi:hypothetical protein
VKRKSFLAIFLAAVTSLSTSCGSGDKIGSVQMRVVGASGGTVNLAGLGGTLQIQVLAMYTSGKQIDETNFATYTVTPQGSYCVAFSSGSSCAPGASFPMPASPQGMTISKTALLTAVDPGICAWVNLGTLAQPGWDFTGWYQVVATYRGFSSNPIFIPLASAANAQSNTNGQCGPA